MKPAKDNNYNRIRHRIFEIIQIGNVSDFPSKAVDIILALAIILNVGAIFLETFSRLSSLYKLCTVIEIVTVIIFTIEYILRIWTADYLYPKEKRMFDSEVKFIFSASGIVDLCCFLPFYLPFVFPAGIVAFRILRVVRIFRLFRINAYYDAFNVITDVIKEKKNQLLSAVFIIIILITASSLIMYNLEHAAQPEAFKNAFSGIWWSVSTMLTVGYGDIYPITPLGQIIAIVMAFLGVGLVAIPTGIISAGFVERWSRVNASENAHVVSQGANSAEQGVIFRPLRRANREIPTEEAIKLLKTEKRATFAVNGDNGYPFAIPVNYFYDSRVNKIYFHGAKSGHKVDSLKKDNRVCFTVYGNEHYEDGDWAPYLHSVVVFGRCRLLPPSKIDVENIRTLARRYYPNEEEIEETIEKYMDGVQMYEIDIEHICGKKIHEK